jgi:hypothetical protein
VTSKDKIAYLNSSTKKHSKKSDFEKTISTTSAHIDLKATSKSSITLHKNNNDSM